MLSFLCCLCKLALASLLLLNCAFAAPALTSASRRSDSFMLFPKLRCALAYKRAGIDIQDFDGYPKFFHNDSVGHLPQAGKFYGAKNIEEYVKFTEVGFTPYLTANNATRITEEKVLGYRNGFCEFLLLLKLPVTLNSYTTTGGPPFSVAVMAKAYLDFDKKYLTILNVFFQTGFLRMIFNEVLNGPNTRRFICETMAGPCSSTFKDSVNSSISSMSTCESHLQAMPATDGAEEHFDGNSTGCRSLHAAFAWKNTDHCAHLSFEPMEDPYGKIKCQTSANISPKTIFTESEFQIWRKFSQKHGIDPDLGHNFKRI